MFLNPDGNGNRQLGIYLLKLELYYTKPGFQKSPAFWIVFNNQDTAANQNLAIDWVIQHLVNCPADVIRDNTVNVNDLLAVINAWGSSPCNAADVGGDSLVNVQDLLSVINSWGACPQ